MGVLPFGRVFPAFRAFFHLRSQFSSGRPHADGTVAAPFFQLVWNFGSLLLVLFFMWIYGSEATPGSFRGLLGAWASVPEIFFGVVGSCDSFFSACLQTWESAPEPLRVNYNLP